MEWLIGTAVLVAALWAIIRASRASARQQPSRDSSVGAADRPSGTMGDCSDWSRGDSGCAADSDGGCGDGGGD
ncbi:hypothetical protein ACFQZQ_07620 [Lysobacter koreensis]|uniref:Uncharacterized protein n=1 Tax=Lysobacter koreensis TaxID=266122 RepID=A0ABW2YLK1_9GAMM